MVEYTGTEEKVEYVEAEQWEPLLGRHRLQFTYFLHFLFHFWHSRDSDTDCNAKGRPKQVQLIKARREL